MTSHDYQLLIITVVSILLLIFLITSKLRFHPLLALLLTAIFVGFTSGLDIDKIVKSIETGAGSTLGETGVTIALGAMLGKILSDSGASDRIATAILKNATPQRLPWLMALAAFIIGIPMFFEVGLIMLLPLIFTIARKLEDSNTIKGSAYIAIGVPVIAALCTMHGMVPPHPGPLISVNQFGANIGLTMIYGMICAIPTIIIAGPLYGKFITPRLSVKPSNDLLQQYTNDSNITTRQPISTALAFSTILVPVVMMLLHAIAGVCFKEQSLQYKVFEFLGSPIIAMFIGVLYALLTLGYLRGQDTQQLRDALGSSLKPIAGIMLIIAGGGAFGQVLEDSGVGTSIVHLADQFSLSALLMGWIVAALLSISTGSATVGIVGATNLLFPLIQADSSINVELLTIAIGSGSLFFNYVNHGGFWLVKESFGMSMGETFKTITIVQSIVGLCGLVMVLLLNAVINLF
ncbi:GntT/GntP/DsdX family permease [Staphylococcus gallinarum]|uniref:GntT/GntP/DsdX family permease n=1 Tax=Staphylococcus gallinarum TaxID=1293 RepID=UPI000D1C6066|nr:gluconate:H+ symporter [Staphylococcus gallinarum]MBU7218137.1 GntP family permease [Staphylococcus gallinarum]MCD8794646.1 GntP family permease [Staphylococcus gallinarum]PTE35957.1 gluconate transporter [Staphylococcus gallinarum]RIL21407.1 gluconate transporter [Staphylococcus gallinarum]RIL24896.1 gluconate transporter [Staphylococcus gallinarum]